MTEQLTVGVSTYGAALAFTSPCLLGGLFDLILFAKGEAIHGLTKWWFVPFFSVCVCVIYMRERILLHLIFLKCEFCMFITKIESRT